MLKSAKNRNAIKGRKGQAEAVVFLEGKGYKILVENYRNALGEIDIIAQDKTNRIIFVEVKARETARFGYPREAVTRDKQRTIRRVAEVFLRYNHITDARCRFDVIEILAGDIRHIENAF